MVVLAFPNNSTKKNNFFVLFYFLIFVGMEIQVPETRGRKRVHKFNPSLKIGESQVFNGTINVISTLAYKWQRENFPDWKIRCYTSGKNKITLIRIK